MAACRRTAARSSRISSLAARCVMPRRCMNLTGCVRRWGLSIVCSKVLGQTLQRYVALYNHQLPQSALTSEATKGVHRGTSKNPIASSANSMKINKLRAKNKWNPEVFRGSHRSHPDLFRKRPYDRPGCNIYPRLLLHFRFETAERRQMPHAH